jgi:penicillin-binding protein 1A
VAGQSVVARLADGQAIEIPWANLRWARPALADGKVGPAPKRADDIVKLGDVVWVEKTRWSWRLTQSPKVEASLVAVNAHDGAIVALVGGYSFQKSHFNRAVQAKRQPGSSFKPFIYAAALAKGYTLASVFNDAPVVTSDREDQLWRPQNDKQHFYGDTRLRVGLEKSRNAVTVRLLQAVGLPFTEKYLKRFAFDRGTVPSNLTLALGTGVVTPEVLTRAYAVIANGGYAIKPHIIQSTTLSQDEGSVPYKPLLACEGCAPRDQLASRVMAPEVNYLIDSALKSVVTGGTGRRALVLKRSDLAGKTGSTENDGWFVGYGGGVVTTAWMGFDQLQPLLEYGSQTALPIWIDFMRVATKSKPTQVLPRPSDIVSVRIDAQTGLLARPGESDMFELFRRSHVPSVYSKASSGPSSGSHQNVSAPIF